MWRLAPMKWKFCFVFNSSSQRHSWGGQLDGVHGAAHEDPDVRDNSQDPGDGMPARPCERFYMLLLLIHSMSLILSLLMRLLMWWSPQTTSNILEMYASNSMVLKQDSVGWITLTCPIFYRLAGSTTHQGGISNCQRWEKWKMGQQKTLTH